MNPDNRLRLLEQSAPADQTPTALPTAGAGLSSPGRRSAPQFMTPWRVVGRMVDTAGGHSIMLGLKYGAALGALGGLYGLGSGLWVLATLAVGTVIGLSIGVLFGMLLGIVEGLALGAISVAWFYPPRSWTRYRQIMEQTSVLVAGVLVPLVLFCTYGLLALLGFSLPVAAVVMLSILLLPISCMCGLKLNEHLVNEYSSVIQVAPGSLPYGLDTVDIHSPAFQRVLFSELQPTYQTVVRCTSLGMLGRWRRQLVALMDLAPEARVCDLMSGAGELWPHILPRLGPDGHLVAVETTPEVLRQAQANLDRLVDARVELRAADALHTGLPDRSVSAVTCAFGAMLLEPLQLNLLADEITRILDDHGIVGLLDLSQPEPALLRRPYLFYLRWGVPLAGFACGGDTYLYGTLARFVERTSVTHQLEQLLARRGFRLYRYQLSGGCACALVGMKSSPAA